MTETDESTPTFPSKFAVRLMQRGFKSSSVIKVLAKDQSVDVYAELLRVLAYEACTRAATQAQKEGSLTCDLEHVEKILPQLIMDF